MSENYITKVDKNNDNVRILFKNSGALIINYDVCDCCGFYKLLFEFDNSGEEYPSYYFCIDCLNIVWQEYYKFFDKRCANDRT